MDSSRLSEFLIQKDGFELIKVTEDEYHESKRFIESPDAIMDDSVFFHIKKVISYLFFRKQLENESEVENKDFKGEYAKQLNRKVLNTLVDGYVGYAWLCEVCSRWIYFLSNSDKSDDFTENKEVTHDGSKTIIYDALMSYLTSKYDTDRMRVYMEDKLSHDSWNPPELYWNLMKSPLVVSHMLKIYRDKPKDEFLSSWYQDYMNNFSSYIKQEQSEMNREGLSRITSNFSVFTLRISEEIHKFLLSVSVMPIKLQNDPLDAIDSDSLDSISPLFWHAENAYIYSQALLHFICQWRVDLRGCRRLSQLISKATVYPNETLRESQASYDYVSLEWSVSQIHLLMTNFSRFPSLHSTFKRLLSSQNANENMFNQQDLCDFYDELNRTLKAFDSYGFLLFDIQEKKDEYVGDRDEAEAEVDESVSQYGDKRGDEYMRLRNAPEMPPLEAIRESNLLNELIDDFANPDALIPDPNIWIKYANLLVLLSVLSPYELLYFHYYEKVSDYIKKMPQREVWQQFYLPPEEYDSDSSINSIDHIDSINLMDTINHMDCVDRIDSINSVDSVNPVDHVDSVDVESEGEVKMINFTASSITTSEDEIKTESRIHKAWQSESSILSSNVFSNAVSSNSCGRGSEESFYEYKRRRVSSDEESRVMDEVQSEYMEIKSTLESAIYKNINEQTKLGPGKNISRERLEEMRELYGQFKARSEKLMGIARKELYQLYKLIHNSLDEVESEFEMRNCMTTNIAASVIISYINQKVGKGGNIRHLCDVKLMLLKEIADRHPVKRNYIILLLRDFCKLCVIGKTDEGSDKLERLEAIVDLMVYISRFERQFVTIIAVFDSIINIVDRSICRMFISKMLKYCGPPYSLSFSLAFIKLIDKFISLGNGGTSVQVENSLMNKFINPFIQECLENNFNNQQLVQIAKRCDFRNIVQ